MASRVYVICTLCPPYGKETEVETKMETLAR